MTSELLVRNSAQFEHPPISPFQGGNTGSNPVGGAFLGVLFFRWGCFCAGHDGGDRPATDEAVLAMPAAFFGRLGPRLGCRTQEASSHACCCKDLWCSLECTLACQAGGRGFKSRQVRARHRNRNDLSNQHDGEMSDGSRCCRGRVAQSAERAPEKREVTGSTPVPTTQEMAIYQVFRI